MRGVDLARTVMKISHRFIDLRYKIVDIREISQSNSLIRKRNQSYITRKTHEEKYEKTKLKGNLYFLLGASFFGFWKSDNEEEEPEYITAMKRSILLTQVRIYIYI